ncbi:MAG: hypothetical protein AAFZ91_09425 [Pseudomonadota bacterium]
MKLPKAFFLTIAACFAHSTAVAQTYMSLTAEQSLKHLTGSWEILDEHREDFPGTVFDCEENPLKFDVQTDGQVSISSGLNPTSTTVPVLRNPKNPFYLGLDMSNVSDTLEIGSISMAGKDIAFLDIPSVKQTRTRPGAPGEDVVTITGTRVVRLNRCPTSKAIS